MITLSHIKGDMIYKNKIEVIKKNYGPYISQTKVLFKR